MRTNQTCPKCARRKFLVTGKLRQPNEQSSNGTHTVFPVTLEYEPAKSFFEAGTRPTLGSFETWMCLWCGYTEFYARGIPRDIEAIAAQHPDQLRVVDAEVPSHGPYR